MYLFDYNRLQIGDIILMRTNDRTCQKIREYSKSNYSHALVYDGNYCCLESNAFGVQSVNIQRLAFNNIDDAIVMRLKAKRQFGEMVSIINNGRRLIGY